MTWPPARDPPGAHLAFIEARAEHVVIVGPLKRGKGLIIGSPLIIKAANEGRREPSLPMIAASSLGMPIDPGTMCSPCR
jgi:hypothetical protein